MTNNNEEILKGLFVKYNGEWQDIYDAIQRTECPEDRWTEAAIHEGHCITILDDEYPEMLKHKHQPPFVLSISGYTNITNVFNELSQNKTMVVGIVGESDSSRLSQYNIKKTIAAVEDICKNYSSVIFVVNIDNGVGMLAAKTAIRNKYRVICISPYGIDSGSIYQQNIQELISSQYVVIISTRPRQYNQISANPSIQDYTLIGKLAQKVLITAGYTTDKMAGLAIATALNNGSDVYAIPDGFKAINSLSNKMLQEGATFYDNPEDLA